MNDLESQLRALGLHATAAVPWHRREVLVDRRRSTHDARRLGPGGKLADNPIGEEALWPDAGQLRRSLAERA